MPRQNSSAAGQLADKGSTNSLELVAELAKPLAEYILSDYERDDWRNSQVVEALARVAALLESEGRQTPLPVLEVLRDSSEAGQPIGVA
jgi:hypothetical protein